MAQAKRALLLLVAVLLLALLLLVPLLPVVGCRAIAGVEGEGVLLADAGGAPDPHPESGAPIDCAAALVCDDFEREPLDRTRWASAGPGLFTVDTSKSFRGSRSLHVHADPVAAGIAGRYEIQATLPITLPGHAFVRFYVFFASPVWPGSWSFAHAQETVDPWRGINLQRRDGMVASTNWAENPNATTFSGVALPVDAWICVELELDRDGRLTTLFVDGKEVAELRRSPATLPPLGAIALGLGTFDPSPAPAFDLWYDELVVATRRIGCL